MLPLVGTALAMGFLLACLERAQPSRLWLGGRVVRGSRCTPTRRRVCCRWCRWFLSRSEGATDLWRARIRADSTARQELQQIWRQASDPASCCWRASVGCCLVPLAVATGLRDPDTVLGRERSGLPSSNRIRWGQSRIRPGNGWWTTSRWCFATSTTAAAIRSCATICLVGRSTIFFWRPFSHWVGSLHSGRSGRARYRLLFIWLAIMFSCLRFCDTQAPHTLRGAGALPPLVLLYAVGAQTLLGASSRLIFTALWRRGAAVGGALDQRRVDRPRLTSPAGLCHPG